MITIRKIESFELIFEPQQRMYRLINNKNDKLSYWFNSNDLGDVLVMTDEEFKCYSKVNCLY